MGQYAVCWLARALSQLEQQGAYIDGAGTHWFPEAEVDGYRWEPATPTLQITMPHCARYLLVM